MLERCPAHLLTWVVENKKSHGPNTSYNHANRPREGERRKAEKREKEEREKKGVKEVIGQEERRGGGGQARQQ
jgi:hypothetical protein